MLADGDDRVDDVPVHQILDPRRIALTRRTPAEFDGGHLDRVVDLDHDLVDRQGGRGIRVRGVVHQPGEVHDGFRDLQHPEVLEEEVVLEDLAALALLAVEPVEACSPLRIGAADDSGGSNLPQPPRIRTMVKAPRSAGMALIFIFSKSL